MTIKQIPNELPRRLVYKKVSKARVHYFKEQRIKYGENRGRLPRGKQSQKAWIVMSDIFPYIYYLGFSFDAKALVTKGTLTNK